MTTSLPPAAGPLLSVRNLAVSYRDGAVSAVRGVSFDVPQGSVVAIVGESGSGKSTTMLAVLGLLPSGSRIEQGSIAFAGEEISGLPEKAMRLIRGRRIGLVPQDPSLSLDPTMRVGYQIAEVLRIHGLATRRQGLARAVEILGEVGMDDPARRAAQYPHELSGGMRQRVLIGIAWACRPRLILADEPTSALDVTLQRQILDHLDRLREEAGTTVVLVTHDLSVAAERAGHIVVMSNGRVVEEGSTEKVLVSPDEEYTRELVASIPGRRRSSRPVTGNGKVTDALAPASKQKDLVVVDHLVKEFSGRSANGSRFQFRAVDDVSFTVHAGETLALVGESGSGKTTTARIIMCLERPTSGQLRFDGQDTKKLSPAALRRLRRRFQMVYQNPYSSLDPRKTIRHIIEEPMRAFGIGDKQARRARVAELLDRVALPSGFAGRLPAELSGGQRQRVAIARALALEPELVVCDEPVSSLDRTVQAQILDLLVDLQQQMGLSYLVISHDLAVVRAISDRIAVMRSGKLVEIGDTADVYDSPQHEYTQALIAAIPVPAGGVR